MMPGPLSGLKVYEIGWGAPGAITGMLLADYGATVIKVERPGPGAHRTSSTRPFWDRGKWSIELDLDEADAVATLIALLDDADVVIESLGVGQATRRGFGYDTVHTENPALVYCSVSAYGQDGPLRDRPGYDSLVAARLGIMAEQMGHRKGPKFLGHPSIDYCTSFLASIGILAALRARFHTGAGQFIDTSLLDGALAVSLMNWWWNEKNLSYLAREGTETGFGHNRLITDMFICQDGEYLMNHTGGDGGFKRTMDILGLGDKVRTIEGLEFAVPLDEDEYHAARHLVPEAFKTRPRDEWIKLLHDSDLAALPVLRPHEVLNEPQVQFGEVVVEIPDADGRIIRQVGPTIRFEKTPTVVPDRAPHVGEHNDRVEELLSEQHESHAPRTSEATLASPLQGIRVLDLSAFFATAFGARLLSDLGADVIKIEPLSGDQMRPLPDLFEGAQRGKRNISIDLRSAEGLQILYELVKTSDVVMHNQRPGKAEKLGIGYEQLRAINPDLIYCYLPGFGSDGPMRELKSFAPLVSGYTGHLYSGAGRGNPPVSRVVGNEDLYNGFAGAVAVLLALVNREATGTAQYVESPHMYSSLFVRTELGTDLDGNPVNAIELNADQTGLSPLYRIYRTSDGWVCIACVGQRAFVRLTEALELAHLAADPRFVDEASRDEHATALETELEARFAQLDTDQAIERLEAHDVPVEVAVDYPVMPEFLWDEWALETERIYEHHHPEHGWIREVGMIFRLSDTPALNKGTSVRLGQNTRELLTELGYVETAVDALLTLGVCRVP
jgi:crotonobetainyl-CoA:carnitine CoA-transferase CaiB-like acyl-CoA transferase